MNVSAHSFLFFFFLCFILKALCTDLLQTVNFHLTQSYISDKCITYFLFQRKSINGANYICTSAPKWPAGYKWTLYVSYTLRDHVREPLQRKSTMCRHLHSKLLHTYTADVVTLRSSVTQGGNLSILLSFNICIHIHMFFYINYTLFNI